MPAIRRKLSPSPKLTTRASEFSSKVTLFEVADIEQTARRSQRVRKEVKHEIDVDESLLDLEDLAYDPSSVSSSSKRAQKVTPRKRVKARAGTASRSVTPVEQKVKSPKTQKPKAAKPVPQTLAKPHPAPPRWRETYDIMKAMRTGFVAPVDTMGCQRAQDEEKEPRNRRFATLVALMLSSQTKDEIMHEGTQNIREILGGSISIEGMIAAKHSDILHAIRKVGFLNKKAVYIKEAAIRLRDEFNSDVPKTVDELCSLKGVGPKMAFLTLEIAWNITTGIGVDVHVHRITNLLGWHKPKTTTPEQTRLNLQSWLPKELWRDINHMMVGFGQVVCQPQATKCDICDLSSKGLCPGARTVVPKSKKSKGSPAKIKIAIEDSDGD